MKEKNKAEIPVGHSDLIIGLFFWIGIFSAFMFRIITIVEHYNPLLSKMLWYAGVTGYLIFFIHRYNIALRRYNVIQRLDLLKKIENKDSLDTKDFEALRYVLWSITVSKERQNYMIIFIFSIIAIIIAGILDFGLI